MSDSGDDGDARETLKKRISETLRWCSTRLKSGDAGSLRTPVLKPGSMGGPGEDPLPADRRHEIRQEEVERICLVRKRLVRQDTWGYWKLPADLGGGRILLYQPDANRFDGAASRASAGFFDGDNLPPWDTWLCYFAEDPGILLAWVPPEFVSAADEGIQANPERCIRWAAQDSGELSRQLKEWGLLL